MAKFNPFSILVFRHRHRTAAAGSLLLQLLVVVRDGERHERGVQLAPGSDEGYSSVAELLQTIIKKKNPI
jgi:hypothetical protein